MKTVKAVIAVVVVLTALVWFASQPAWAATNTVSNGSTVYVNSDNHWPPATDVVFFSTHNGGFTSVSSTNGPHSVPNPVLIGGTDFGGQRFNFDGSNNLTFTNTVALAGVSGGVGGDNGEGVGVNGMGSLLVTFSGGVTETGTAYFVKYGIGTLALTGSSTFTGPLRISGGALRADDGVGLAATHSLQFDGGVLETSGTFNRTVGTGAGQVRWGYSAGGSGGFSAFGGPLTVDLNTAGANNFTWNSGWFMGPGFGGPYTLKFGSTLADNVVTFVDNINLNGAQTIDVADNPATTTDQAVIAGNLTGTGSSGFTKTGAGTLVLAGNNTYAGATTVSAGSLLVNGTLSGGGGAVTVSSGGLLGGTGTVNRAVSVQNGGTLSVGASPGIMVFGAGLTLESNSVFAVDINGLTPGTEHDRADVTGAVSISNAVLQLSVGGVIPPNTPIEILRNDETDPVLGYFMTPTGDVLGEGAKFGQWQISYVGVTGNDVTLTLLIPEPSTLLLLGLGMLVVWGRRTEGRRQKAESR